MRRHPIRPAVVSAGALLVLTLTACTVDTEGIPVESPRPVESISAAVDDPYVGYYDTTDAPTEAGDSAMWGSFGAEGSVAAAGWTDESTPAGRHVITVECVGPPDVELSVAPGPVADTAAPIRQTVGCPGVASVEVSTQGEPLSITIDSHDEPGAYRVTLTNGS